MGKFISKANLERIWRKTKAYTDRKFDDVNPIGLFNLQYDAATGNLYAVYPDGSPPPAFEYEKDTGNLYYITSD